MLVHWLLLVAVTLLPAPVIDFASPAQQAAFEYGPMPQCASGGWGSGKTYNYCLKALWLSDTFPKNRGLIFRSVGKELRATTMATFYKLCPARAYQHGKRNDQEGRLVLNNGSEILFMHLEDPDIQGIIRGLEINWFFGDQAEEDPEHMETIVDMLLGRLSRWDVAGVPAWMLDRERVAGREWPWKNPTTGRPMPPPYAMLACNPDTELHWIYRRFHPESADHQRVYKAQGYKLFEIHTADNKFLPQSNKDALLAHDDAFVARNYFGRWGYAAGTIHTIPNDSLVEGSYELLEYLRRSCTLHRTLDYGDSAPTCCLWWAVDRNGNSICYREYYLPNALISTHRRNIAELSEGERYDTNLADPSIFHQMPTKQGGRWSVGDEFADVISAPRETALFFSPADNNELGTRNRLNEYLRVDPDRVHPFTRALGSPRLFFVRVSDAYPQGCYHVLREMRSQRRVKIGTDLGKSVFSDERDGGVSDHAYDCTRYHVAARPPVARVQMPATDGSFFSARQRLAKRQKTRMSVR